MNKEVIFEAIINGDEVNTIDPVIKIKIDNGYHEYEYSAEEVKNIMVRIKKELNP